MLKVLQNYSTDILMAYPGLFLFIFGHFEVISIHFLTNQCEDMSIKYSVLRSNPQSLEHESSPVTSRPSLPSIFYWWYYLLIFRQLHKEFKQRKKRRLKEAARKAQSVNDMIEHGLGHKGIKYWHTNVCYLITNADIDIQFWGSNVYAMWE